MKLTDKFKITDAECNQRLSFLHLAAADCQLLASLRRDLEKLIPGIVSEFYVELLNFPNRAGSSMARVQVG